MTLLICPVRPGDSNEELRYALRTWEANLRLPDLRLLVVGFRPSWLEPDMYLKGNAYASSPLSVWDNIWKASLTNQPNGEQTLYMNDDFLCTRPVTEVKPVKRNISLRMHIAKFPPNGGGWWAHSLRLTADLLDHHGFFNADSYELHRPFACSPVEMLWAMSQWEGGTKNGVPQWRTLAGVLNGIEAEPVADAKLGYPGADRGSEWVSTSDASWPVHKRRFIDGFQKPSRWEVSGF